jgi:hypothetical protein
LEPPSKGFGVHDGIAQAQLPPVLGASERGFDALRDHLSLLFRERRIDVEREVVAVSPECGDDEMHLMLHEPGDEVHVSRKPVEP